MSPRAPRPVSIGARLLALLLAAGGSLEASPAAHVRVSPRDPRYFELSDGRPYVPVGLNLIAPGAADPDGLAVMDGWMRQLAANGGNFIRVWLSSPFWDVEHERSGPFKLYARDTHGMLLHDVLFAPFFAGAAGPGQIWHWNVYVDANRLWHHFGRFAAAIAGIDVPAESFEPIRITHPALRIYALKGKGVTLAWCRDAGNDWEQELAQGRPPARLEGLTVDLAGLVDPGRVTHAEVYDPWVDQWSQVRTRGSELPLPAFSRSVVIRIRR